MKRAKILLLEDDISLSETVCEYLEENGYEVMAAYDGEEAKDKIYEFKFDLLLLDVNVPNISGYEVLKNARKEGNQTPAIYVTSLDGIDDLSRGFESGCDDYIRKPFALKELLIRIESILKRSFSHIAQEKLKINNDLFYDIDGNNLEKEGVAVLLNPKETKLLKLFLQNKNRLISHEEIYDKLWNYDEAPSESALRTYIKNLRKTIGKEKIVSFKKLGYKLIN